MLEGLGAVDWAALEHAYGSAGDVPELIRALRDRDPEVRNRALWQLWGNIYHQGSRFQASAAAVPFLLELVVDPATPGRSEIVRLLAALAIGYDEAWVPGAFPVAAYRTDAAAGEQLLRAAPPVGAGDGGVARRAYFESLAVDDNRVGAFFELAAYDAVRAGVAQVGALLADEAPALRVAAAYALAWFPEEAAVSVPVLGRAVADSDPAVATTALVAVGLVGGANETHLVESMLGDPRVSVRWAAAVALASLRGPAAGPGVAAELLAWSGGSSQPHLEVPFLDGDLAGYASRALLQLGQAHEDASFAALLARLPRVSGTEALAVAQVAMRRAFPAGPVPEGTLFAALDRRQQRLVEVLAGSPATWTSNGLLFGNFIGLVGWYGLPDDPEGMRAYVAGGEPTSGRLGRRLGQ